MESKVGPFPVTPEGEGQNDDLGCAQFLRQFSALVRKNALTKRRAKLPLLLELAVPAVIVLLIGTIKSVIDVEKKEETIPAMDAPAFTYAAMQDTVSYPYVLCYDNNMFLRCGCHLDEEVIEVPSDYSSGMPVSVAGPAMWSASHGVDNLFSFCTTAIAALTGTTSITFSASGCVGTRFTRAVCGLNDFPYAALGLDVDGIPELDDACGPGTSDIELTPEEYVSIITDAKDLLEGFERTIIPEDDIDGVCETLTFAVMPSNDGGGAAEAAVFFDYVTTTFPQTAHHWVSYDSESEFMDIITDEDYSQDPTDDRPAFSAAIIFTSGSPAWAYTIRANTTKSDVSSNGYYLFNTPETDTVTENNCKSPVDCPADDAGRNLIPWTAMYHQSVVPMLQQLVDTWIMTTEGGNIAAPPVVHLTDFPNPSYTEDGFWSSAGSMFPVLVVIAVLYPLSNVISALVKEKELRIKEGLKMMGLTAAAHTASWIFHFVVLFVFVSLLMVMVSGTLFEHSDSGLVFTYLFLFFMSSIAFCFFVASFFSRAKTASTIGTMAFFIALFPFFAISGDDVSPSSRRAGCLLPPTCLALGTMAFAEFEDSGEGVTHETAGESENGFTFNDVLIMFVVDTIVFSVLAWYAGNVIPSEWGTANSSLFFLAKSYWFPGSNSSTALAEKLKDLQCFESEKHAAVEPVGDDLRSQVAAGKCVAIRGLIKQYKNSTGGSKLAVDKLDLTMYSGQITALLGHNGAGKTTTIGMLTGMIPISSGCAFVAGRDAIGDMVNIRRNLGVCPQHDILYPDLTVREHLRMYAVLKSVPRSRLQETIQATLSDVGLTEKENELTQTLSGGQKRKLSVGIALIGGSKVVFLDEPTSGMDPHSRRFTWDLIRKNREGRVIVLTTHFMDEADLLGDRVAIMADGALRCCGSSLFLKNNYGVGYNLTIVRDIKGNDAFNAMGNHLIDNDPEGNEKEDEKVDEERGAGSATVNQGKAVKPIRQLVRSHVKAATLLSNVGAEVSFQLPNDASSTFEGLLTEIDSRKAELGVNSYGMSVTTLEEVFLRVANGTADVEARNKLADISLKRRHSQSSSSMVKAETAKTSPPAKAGRKEDLGIEHSKSLFRAHMVALLKKRLLTFKRDKKMWAFTVIMPAIFVLCGILILLSTSTHSEPSLVLTPEDYKDGGTPFPYATECTLSGDACDVAALVAEMDFADVAEPVSLGLDDTVDSDAVELMNTALFEQSFDSKVYGAVSFRDVNSTNGIFDYTIHANYSAPHSVPVYTNLVNEAILRLVTGDDALSITTTLHPMPRTVYESSLDSGFDSFNVVLFILIAFSFVPTAWIAYIVREKETKCKHQQVVSGVGLDAYWLSSYLWDSVSMLLPVGFTLIVLAASDVKALINGEAAGATILLFLMYSISMPSYTYIWSFAFKTYSSAQNTFLFHNWIAGLILPIATTIMSFFPGTVGDVSEAMIAVLRICPHFALGNGLLNMSFMSFFSYLNDTTYTPLDTRITGSSLVYMAVFTPVFLVALLVLERAAAGGGFLSGAVDKLLVGRRLRELTLKQLGDEDTIDTDVRDEMDRVAIGGADEDVVKIASLRKVYPINKGAKVAVKSTSLGIPRGECFGLLGINGAGKSSTLSILSGELPPTSGSAYLGGFDVTKNPEEIHRLVGYCPQFDALFETLTAREHLMLYAAIKGIPEEKRHAAVEEKIDEMGLRQYCDRPAGGYSGGNKRKLSVAMAMIGDPQIVFLDEPSTGMDPMARRFMWNVIMRIVTENKECAMILTTHSMEECEALCQRIGIMVGGRLRCMGSSQHLKTRFGKGFQLEARVAAVSSDETDTIMAAIAEVTNGQETLTEERGVLRAVLSAAQSLDLYGEISAEGRGAGIYHAIANQGSVPIKDFVSWICLEKKCSRVIAFVEENFQGGTMREKQNAKMRFEFPQQEGQSLAQTFGFIESHRKSLSIGEYALSQTSLEQVFNGFAAQQEEELGQAAGMI